MNNSVPRAATRLAALMSVSLASVAWSQTFEFSIDQQSSGLSANLGVDVSTSGSLVGDWDPVGNPGGTRTKPGIFGDFGAGENVPVGVALGLSLAGDLESASAGWFELSLDVGAGTVSLGGFETDLLAGGPVGLPAVVSVEPLSFRTRAPDSVYLGVPLEVPAGEVVVSTMTLERMEGGSPGTLIEIEPGRYAFEVVAPARLDVSFSLNGWPVEISATPVAVAVSGEVVVSGGTARVTSVYSIDHADWQEPGVDLPQFPIDVPTVLPPGQTSHVLMSLTLDEIGTSLLGELSLEAAGVRTGCDGDYNGDGAVNTVDVIAFLGAWSGRDAAADFNGDGRVDSRDVVEFLDAWAGGC